MQNYYLNSLGKKPTFSVAKTLPHPFPCAEIERKVDRMRRSKSNTK
jgi:hypothetical protein